MIDIIITGYIIDKSFVIIKREFACHQIVYTEQDHIFIAQFFPQCIKINIQIIGKSGSRFMLVISPGRCIQNHLFIFRNLESFFDHPDIFRCMVDQEIISRIADLHHFVFHTGFFQVPGGNKFLTGKSGRGQNIIKFRRIHRIFFADIRNGIDCILRILQIISQTL